MEFIELRFKNKVVGIGGDLMENDVNLLIK